MPTNHRSRRPRQPSTRPPSRTYGLSRTCTFTLTSTLLVVLLAFLAPRAFSLPISLISSDEDASSGWWGIVQAPFGFPLASTLFSSSASEPPAVPVHTPLPQSTVHQKEHSNIHAHAPDKRRPFTRNIVAVGDLHGDLGNALLVLHMARVIVPAGLAGVNISDDFEFTESVPAESARMMREWQWSGEVDVFVQTGDIIDRGDDTIALFALMDMLRAQAHGVGGLVMTHLGNHEWMNAIGDWRYVYPTEIKTFGSISARQQMISTGWIGRSWAANYTTASRLLLHPSLGPPNADYVPSSAPSALSHAAFSFVHGGLAPNHPALSPFPSAINTLATSLLRRLQNRKQPPPHPPNPYPGLPEGTTPEEARLYATDGPLWYRGWALDPEAMVCKKVDDVLVRTGTRRMVMGHTPDFEKIVARCNGKIIIIDTGISHAYGGALSALSVTYKLIPDSNGGWNEEEVVRAIYADRSEGLVNEGRVVHGDFELYH